MLKEQFASAEEAIQKVIVTIQEKATLQEINRINEFWESLKSFERFAQSVEEKRRRDGKR